MLPTGSHPTLWSWLLHFIRYKFKLLIFVSFFFLAPLHNYVIHYSKSLSCTQGQFTTQTGHAQNNT